ncbi:MAG: histidine kinase [Gammaproteobacteria bacterium]|nr:histidine kinase [Gammaproteobacteria bacterium]
MDRPDQDNDSSWFDAGWAVFKGTDDPGFYPPLNDMVAQREWLGGFGAAWVEYPEDEIITSILNGDGWESLDKALARALNGRLELLGQLRMHSIRRVERMIH